MREGEHRASRRREEYSISTPEQLKAVADPLRQRILGALVKEPRTTKQVAELLDQPPTRLYHHVDLLEKAGLIELVATKPKRGTIEKYFQAVACRFTVSNLYADPELQDTISRAFRSAESAVRHEQASNSEHPRAMMALGTLRLTESQFEKLRERLAKIVDELRDEQSDEARQSYGFLAAVYPSLEGDSEC